MEDFFLFYNLSFNNIIKGLKRNIIYALHKLLSFIDIIIIRILIYFYEIIIYLSICLPKNIIYISKFIIVKNIFLNFMIIINYK